MKIKMISVITGVALFSGLVISPVVMATPDVSKGLAGASALELSAKAASLVAKASAADKKDVSIAVVKTAVAMNPSAAVAIVSAVVRESPANAAVIAVTAATIQDKRIGQIAKAAAAAAPAEVSKIVAAMLKEFPREYGVIASGAAEGAPAAGREILAVVADYIPALQASIQGATAHYKGDAKVPVQAVLSQSYTQALSSGAVVSTQVPASLTPGAGVVVSQDAAGFGGGVVYGSAGVSRVSMAYAAMPTYAVASPIYNAPMLPILPSFSPPKKLSGPTLGNSFPGYSPTPPTLNPLGTGSELSGGRDYATP